MNTKTLAMVLILFSSYLFGQANRTDANNKSTFKGTYTLRTDQKPLAQSIELTGGSVYQEDGVLSCRSDCEVKLGYVLVKADEVDFQTYTGEAEARGNVRIKALPVRAADTLRPWQIR
jgi:lipopolysaccharide assembly outer membrane protein LptD (OstA)